MRLTLPPDLSYHTPPLERERWLRTADTIRRQEPGKNGVIEQFDGFRNTTGSLLRETAQRLDAIERQLDVQNTSFRQLSTLAEDREVRRILEELTDAVRPRAADLEVNLHVLAELDSLFARAKYALSHGGTPPELGGGDDREEYRVVDGVENTSVIKTVTNSGGTIVCD